ncbi:Sigma-fimbriae chaperone protein [uncultured Candidatus Thioglobus sp.]|nr:Sigma-fimbriae chaperone protein [uncultured Candidatus Thioglobus sp.]
MNFLLLLSTLISLNAFAWNVSPMSQDIEPGQRTFQIKINNKNGKEPLAVRLKAMKRDTDEFAKDKLNNTNDLLIFPRQMIVAAGKQVVARVSVRTPNTGTQEKPYRLIIDQIPVKKTADERGIKVLTRYLTSIYLIPKARKVEDFSIRSAQIKNNNIEIIASNQGNYHKVLLPSSVKVGNQEINQKFAVKNILPGKSIKIILPIDSKNFSSGQNLSFDNTCMVCPKGEKYQIKLQ